MSKPHTFHWLFKIYFLIYGILSINYLIDLYVPYSKMFLFYHVLMAFNIANVINYDLAVLSSLLNITALVPIYLYIYKRRFLDDDFWKKIFSFRVAFEFTGHQYEYNFIKSLFHFPSFDLGIYTIALLTCITLPSYLIFYQYAFASKNLGKS